MTNLVGLPEEEEVCLHLGEGSFKLFLLCNAFQQEWAKSLIFNCLSVQYLMTISTSNLCTDSIRNRNFCIGHGHAIAIPLQL